MFSKIYIEQDCIDSKYAQNILEKFDKLPIVVIDRLEDYFEKVKKPYLQKRENLNIFIANKKGQLVKKTPPAYGTNDGDHYYYIHAFNCIYECDYCYLQGYFSSPDLVFFVNHEQITQSMDEIAKSSPQKNIWFHAGEYSDSLAMSHITKELTPYDKFLANNPNAIIELRTKSAQIKEVLQMKSRDNLIVSFSISPADLIKEHDHKTAPLRSRIHALKKLCSQGFQVALHFDPIIYRENVIKDYQELFETLKNENILQKAKYHSLGVVRFTSNVFKEVQKNYPDSNFYSKEFTQSFDNKLRYPRPMRMHLLHSLKDQLIKSGVLEKNIYFCME